MVRRKKVAKRISLPQFIVRETCDSADENALTRTIRLNDTTVSYACRPVCADNGQPLAMNTMCFVVDGTGAPWAEACLFLVDRVETTLGLVRPATISCLAADLAAYQRFLEDEGIDFRDFPKAKHARPTYRYRGYLLTKVRSGEKATSTARRRMQTVVSFYRWLRESTHWSPANEMWTESDVYISMSGISDRKIRKRTKTTNMAISSPEEIDPSSLTIRDEGKLRPLPINEQEHLVKLLVEIGNTEMTLIHLICLFTGGRAQTVLTLRDDQFRAKPEKDTREVPVSCGPGSGVDTKGDRKLTLFFPGWLYGAVRDYTFSARAAKRRARRRNGHSRSPYLFVSSHGMSYYDSRKDATRITGGRLRRYSSNGAAIRMFLKDRVLPDLRKQLGQDFHYSLHDLRATFGMNLMDAQLAMVEQGQITLHEAREFVKLRMGHQSSATTDLYLQYRSKVSLAKKVQDVYEARLKGLIDSARSICESSYDPC